MVDFKNTIIIMTSNLGSDLILDDADSRHSELDTGHAELVSASKDSDIRQNDGGVSASTRAKVDALLKATFRPEFLNRIDEIVMFGRLSKDCIGGIVKNQLERVKARLADRRITLEFDQSAIDFLSDVGYDPAFGARPVKRAVQTYVENPLAKEMLSGRFGEDARIIVKADEGTLTFA